MTQDKAANNISTTYKKESENELLNQSQRIAQEQIKKEANRSQICDVRQQIQMKRNQSSSSSSVSSQDSSSEDLNQDQIHQNLNAQLHRNNKRDYMNLKNMQLMLQIPEISRKLYSTKAINNGKFPKILKKREGKIQNGFELKGTIIKNLEEFPGLFKTPYVENAFDCFQNQINTSPILRNRIKTQQEQIQQQERIKRDQVNLKGINNSKFKRPISPSKQIENKITLKIPTIPHYYTFYDNDREVKQKEVSKLEDNQISTVEANKIQFGLKDQVQYQSRDKFKQKQRHNFAIGLYKQPEMIISELKVPYKAKADPILQPKEPQTPQLDFSKAQFYKMLSLCFQQYNPESQTQYKVFKKSKFEKFDKQKQEDISDFNKILQFQEDDQDFSF